MTAMSRPCQISAARDEHGSMSLALILIVFILMFATLVTSTVAWQLVGDRNESLSRRASSNLDSVLNIAAQNLGTSTQALPAVAAAAPTTWTTSDDGAYAYRWWIEANSALSVTAYAEIALFENPVSVYRAIETFSWDPVINQWVPTGVIGSSA